MDEKGTSIIELLIALAVVGLVISGFMSVYWFANRSYERQTNQATAQFDARMAKEMMIRDVARSTVMDILDDDNNIIGLGDPGTQLYLETMTEQEDGSMITDNIQYFVEDGSNTYSDGLEHTMKLHRMLNNIEPAELVTDDCKVNVSFADAGAGLLTFHIQVLDYQDESTPVFALTGQCSQVK